MAVLGLGVVVSLITLYLINRLGQRMLAFEHMFFIGLTYCVEPTPASLAAVAATSSAAAALGGAAAASAKNKGGKAGKRGRPSGAEAGGGGAKPSTAKATPADLPIVRNGVGAGMFVGEPTLPKSVEFDYLMGMVTSFVIAYLVEDAVMCALPNSAPRFTVSQTHWFGALIFAVSTYELLDLTRAMSSGVVVGILVTVGTVIALALIANGDSTSFFMLDAAFRNVGAWAEHVHVERLSLPDATAPQYARVLTAAARIATGLLAGLLFASSAVPARRFAALDFELCRRYLRGGEGVKGDVYALPKPTHWLALAVALDHVLPVAALATFSWGRPSDAAEPFGALRVGSFVGVVALRLALSRARLQAYLDTAVAHFRSFWAERRTSAGGDLEAGNRLRTRAVTTYYHLSTLGCLHSFGPVVLLTLALVARRSGGLSLGICAAPVSVDRVSLAVAAREILSFLAWYYLAAHAVFSTLSLSVDTLVERLDPPRRPPSDGAGGAALSSSERRKLRRRQAAKEA